VIARMKHTMSGEILFMTRLLKMGRINNSLDASCPL
jgi:hypothetical protein